MLPASHLSGLSYRAGCQSSSHCAYSAQRCQYRQSSGVYHSTAIHSHFLVFLLAADACNAGLDARAAAIVMRTVRNIVNTGRTIVCTIHQPSIDIFESFDELLLLKRGGETIFNGQLGHNSSHLIEYFQVCRNFRRLVTKACCTSHALFCLCCSYVFCMSISVHMEQRG